LINIIEGRRFFSPLGDGGKDASPTDLIYISHYSKRLSPIRKAFFANFARPFSSWFLAIFASKTGKIQ